MILSVYSYPTIRTTVGTKSLRLPPVTAPDLGLYLSLSKLATGAPGTVLNPFYHVSLPANSAPYLKFRFSPLLFGILDDILGNHLWLALLLWNLLWWFLFCVAAIWLFERFLPFASVELVMFGVALLLLVNVAGIWHIAATFGNGSPEWLSGALPYIRPFTPQVVMPLFVMYLGLQIRALQTKKWKLWAMMAAVQFVAFLAFPYVTLMMAGLTLVAGIWYVLSTDRRFALPAIVSFGVICAVADIGFALHGSSGLRYGFPDHSRLIDFQPALLAPSIGKFWILTAVMLVAIAATGKIRPEVKWPLIGMGVTNMLLMLGDAVLSQRVFFLTDHIGYFYQSTIIILLMFLLAAYVPRDEKTRRRTSTLALIATGICVVFGFLMAEGNYRINKADNQRQADLAAWFAGNKVSAQDLVITEFSGAAYDDCEWIPLLSKAQVLYCRNAQLALTPDQNRDLQRFREVLYLYFIGKDHQWLAGTTHVERYGIYGELSTFHSPEELNSRLDVLRREMSPLFRRVEDHDPDVRAFFGEFRRVWILESRENAQFVSERLDSYVNLQQKTTLGSLIIFSAVPK